jgi:hypothetical protein
LTCHGRERGEGRRSGSPWPPLAALGDTLSPYFKRRRLAAGRRCAYAACAALPA